MKDVYYFSSSLSPLNDYWILKELLENNISVKVIDIYGLINDESKDIAVENTQVEFFKVCASVFELDDVLVSIGFGQIVFAPAGGGISEKIRNDLTVKGVSVVCDTTYSLPIVSLSMKMGDNEHYNNPVLNVLRVFRTKGIGGFTRHCLDFMRAKFPFALTIEKKTSNDEKRRENTYLVTSGAKNHLAYPLVRDAYNQIKVGHFSVICRETKLKRVVSDDYWVFIDQAIPFHRDAKRVGVNYEPFADGYYQSLINFFKFVEESTNKKVIIALHPRTAESYASHFTGFDTYKGVTEELIEYSDGIISHFSTCIYSAVYLKKPVVLITNELMNMHHDVRRMYDFSERLNKSVIDIDKQTPYEFESHADVDVIAYRHFEENYIKQSDAKDDKAINILRKKLNF